MNYSIHLRATNIETGVDRGYSLFITPGLFNTQTVVIHYGRYGKQNQRKVYAFECIEDLNKFIKRIINKRLTAFKRIGVNYEIIHETGNLNYAT